MNFTDSGNSKEIENVPVKEISTLVEYKDDSIVVIGVGEEYQQDVLNKLKEYRFSRIVTI